jgi:phage-related tail fiber protein
MATTTPNFGWPVPTSTDLVKDGATAIEALGDSIDASLLDLKGGTTGQVLSKTTNTDMDFTWVTSDDANAIQNTIVDAKGDLITATAADTPARLAVGTNGQVLTADSTAATGLKWGTATATPTFVGVNATRTNVSTAITANTGLLIAFTTEEFDTNGFHDNATNNTRLTIPTGYAGKYIISGWLSNPNSPGSYQLLRVYKNGAQYTTGGVREGEYVRNSSGTAQPFGFSQTITASVGDYFELQYQQNNSETVNIWSNFQLSYLGV